MKKLEINAVIFLVSVLFFNSTVFSMTVDELGKATMFLRTQRPRRVQMQGREYEVFLKDSQTGKTKASLESTFGTGFLVQHHKRLFLVTAGHVAKDLDRSSEILWNTFAGKLKNTNLGELQKGMTHSKWFFHQEADIAVHPFGFTEKSEQAAIDAEMFADESKILMSTPVYVLGFPLGIGVLDKLSPLSRKAEIASGITTVSFPGIKPNLKFVLLDTDLAQGYSGAPVFISPDAQLKGNTLTTQAPRLVGVQSSTISDATGGKISLVVPTLYLNEIFKSDDFKTYEKNTGMLD